MDRGVGCIGGWWVVSLHDDSVAYGIQIYLLLGLFSYTPLFVVMLRYATMLCSKIFTVHQPRTPHTQLQKFIRSIPILNTASKNDFVQPHFTVFPLILLPNMIQTNNLLRHLRNSLHINSTLRIPFHQLC